MLGRFVLRPAARFIKLEWKVIVNCVGCGVLRFQCCLCRIRWASSCSSREVSDDGRLSHRRWRGSWALLPPQLNLVSSKLCIFNDPGCTCCLIEFPLKFLCVMSLNHSGFIQQLWVFRNGANALCNSSLLHILKCLQHVLFYHMMKYFSTLKEFLFLLIIEFYGNTRVIILRYCIEFMIKEIIAKQRCRCSLSKDISWAGDTALLVWFPQSLWEKNPLSTHPLWCLLTSYGNGPTE